LQRLWGVVAAGGATVAVFSLTDLKFQLYGAAMPFIRLFEPERAHKLTIEAAKYGMLPSDKRKDDPRLQMHLWGRVFSNPIGVAAGFDKDAEGIENILDMGVGFMEIGAHSIVIEYMASTDGGQFIVPSEV
jgi:dihydroorotate dehydrogenase